jgi:putative peptidoglycan lipid II flippase
MINVPLMAILVGPMGIEGLALALSISSLLEVIGLLWSLQRRIDSIEAPAIAAAVGRATIGAVAAGAAMLGGLLAAESVTGDLLGDPVGRLAVLVLLVAAGVAAYVAVALALRSPELRQLRDAIVRLRRRRAA